MPEQKDQRLKIKDKKYRAKFKDLFDLCFVSLLFYFCFFIFPSRVSSAQESYTPEVKATTSVAATIPNRDSDYEVTVVNQPSGEVSPDEEITFAIFFANKGGNPLSNGRLIANLSYLSDEFASLIEAETTTCDGKQASYDSAPGTLNWEIKLLPSQSPTGSVGFKLKVKPTHAYEGRFSLKVWATLEDDRTSKTSNTVNNGVNFTSPLPPEKPFVLPYPNPQIQVKTESLEVNTSNIRLYPPKITAYPNTELALRLPVTADQPVTIVIFNLDGRLEKATQQGDLSVGKIMTPQAPGRYEVYLRAIDGSLNFLQEKLFDLEVVPLPRVFKDRSLALEGAKVTLLVFNEPTQSYIPWIPPSNQVTNPQFTNGLGQFGWILPEGKYKVKVEAYGFKTKLTAPLTITTPKPWTEDIFLERTFTNLVVKTLTDLWQTLINIARNLWWLIQQPNLRRLVELLLLPLLFLILLMIWRRLLCLWGIPFLLFGPLLIYKLRLLLLPPPTSYWGKVFDSDNEKPLENVKVDLLDLNQKKLAYTFSNNKGLFAFDRSPGKYLFALEKKGWVINQEKQAVNLKPVILTDSLVGLEYDGQNLLTIQMIKDVKGV